MTHASPSKPSFANILRWFDPRARSVGNFAFIMNRLSGLGLTLYLCLHLVALAQLAIGPAAYDGFIAMAKNPVVMVGEYIVVVGGLLHGLNGLRIALTSFAIGIPYQRVLFYSLMSLALVGCLYFAMHMFGGA